MSVIGPYRIERELGRGGMGVVYLAHDTRLGRTVALKALPEEMAGDPERLARFEREAKLLASLNHPNIATIYGVEESEGRRYLALEHIEGESLADRLSRGALSVEESIELCLQIATGLEAAHERGVIHRDLKPGNVMVTPGDQVKIVDFGLAKGPVGTESGQIDSPASSPTITSPAVAPGTMTGVILGTAPYLSPEQARGKAVDRRTDIWSFGCILYECLTGRRAFQGETVSDTVAAILKQEPEWASLPKEISPQIRQLLRRCLEKDPRQRLRDVGEARIVLAEADSGTTLPTSMAAYPGRYGWIRRVRPIMIGAGGVLLGALLWSITSSPPRHVPRLRKFLVALGADPLEPTISPDGGQIAYVSHGALWVQALSELSPRRIVNDVSLRMPFWSPDGQSIGYVAGSKVFRVPAVGGESRLVCDTRTVFPYIRAVAGSGAGACWREDGTIVFTKADSTGVFAVPAEGGDPRTILSADSTWADFHDPTPLPDHRGMLFVAHPRTDIANTIELVREDGVHKDLLVVSDHDIDHPVYSPYGYIVFHRDAPDEGVWAVPFSLSRLAITGKPFLAYGGASHPSSSSEGSLCYSGFDPNFPKQMALVDRAGKDIAVLGQPEPCFAYPVALSPDATRAVRACSVDFNDDLWIYDIAHGGRSRFTDGPGYEGGPCWSRDGRKIAYMAVSGDKPRVVLRNADGTGSADTLAEGGIPSLSPDGKYVVYITGIAGLTTTHLALMAQALDGISRPFRVIQNDPAALGVVSPSGNLIAYVSDISGRWEVYLSRFPSGSGRWQVSTAGGQWPRWNGRGDRLYYAQEDDIMEVPVTDHTSGPERAAVVGTPIRLFTKPSLGTFTGGFYANFDVSRDGTHFLILRPQSGDQSRIALIEDWAAEFQKK